MPVPAVVGVGRFSEELVGVAWPQCNFLVILTSTMAILSKRVQRFLSEQIALGNWKRSKLEKRYVQRKHLSAKAWTVKGVTTRMYGQGAQKLFASFPKQVDVAVAGSVAVAIYDMMQGKKDLDWLPGVVKVFVAVPAEQKEYPLRKAFPAMLKWLDEIRDKGFDYRLVPDSASFGERSISFLFRCRNAGLYTSIEVPMVLFLVRVADSVRSLCDKLDLTVSSPILGLDEDGTRMEMKTTPEIEAAFRTRKCRSRYQVLDGDLIAKYAKRGFQCLQAFSRAWFFLRSAEPLFPSLGAECPSPVPRLLVSLLLGREPTRREQDEFSVDVSYKSV